MATVAQNLLPSTAPLMVTISGIRGIAGDSLPPAIVEKYVTAFCITQSAALKKDKLRIVVGRDSRVSGPWVQCIVHGLLMAQGVEVLNAELVTTPTVQLLVQRHNADGGIVITSSHNPEPWNGLKFIDSDGLFLAPDNCKRLFARADEGAFPYQTYEHCGSITNLESPNFEHQNAIFALPYINVEQIKKRNFKVCLDTVNGAGGPIMVQMLNDLNCTVVELNTEPTGLFAHTPEPIPANLTDLCASVKKHKADIGIALDPDGDRCVLIDENGCPLGEEYTLALAVKFMLASVGVRGPVCKNCASSRAIDVIAKEYGCECVHTPVGEIQVAKKMVEVKSVIGGEGNGGVMLPDLHIGRDAPVAAGLILQYMAENEGKTIGELKAALPQFEIVKLKAPLAGIDPDVVVAHFKKEWTGKEGVTLDEMDGLRIMTDDWWVLLRKSNTEPIIRVMGEGSDPAASRALCEKFLNEITSGKFA
eukprot:TRINITY_DN100_c1_g1_i1.p1 TRINITY_DN100_c1_g1~~TRINITY_DN100_c1_g1_i1.p1  ORF type:complete len:485 (-),score=118.40 TRINITY_DN100_c1_g1_i1:265-1692(-)